MVSFFTPLQESELISFNSNSLLSTSFSPRKYLQSDCHRYICMSKGEKEHKFLYHKIWYLLSFCWQGSPKTKWYKRPVCTSKGKMTTLGKNYKTLSFKRIQLTYVWGTNQLVTMFHCYSERSHQQCTPHLISWTSTWRHPHLINHQPKNYARKQS
jgi:hypothetical protein